VLNVLCAFVLTEVCSWCSS